MSVNYNRQLKERGQEILKRLEGVENPVVAELGVATGNLSMFLLSSRQDLTLIMVDSWLGRDCHPAAYKATGDSNADHDQSEQDRRSNLVRQMVAKFGARAVVVNMSTDDALDKIKDEELDLVFIDADHSVSGCLNDIENYIHKVKDNGWIGGHDYENNDQRFSFGVTEAVNQWAAEHGVVDEIELGENFTWWHQKNGD